MQPVERAETGAWIHMQCMELTSKPFTQMLHSLTKMLHLYKSFHLGEFYDATKRRIILHSN